VDLGVELVTLFFCGSMVCVACFFVRAEPPVNLMERASWDVHTHTHKFISGFVLGQWHVGSLLGGTAKTVRAWRALDEAVATASQTLLQDQRYEAKSTAQSDADEIQDVSSENDVNDK
jgi:poly(3-hydroxybutyrate) depolymerase